MKVYIAKEDSHGVQRVLFWWRDVTDRTTKAAIWPGPAGWGVGYVDIPDAKASHLQDQVVTKRHYGIVKVELKEAKK